MYNRQAIQALLLTTLAVSLFMPASAQDQDKVRELEQRVEKLEKQMAKMEALVAKGQTTPEAKEMMQAARQHVESERAKFEPRDIEKAEKLYQKAAQILSTDDSKVLLDSVVAEYPQLNRAGCAQLYRAQQESGQERERLLKDCIERFYTCYYLDGAQVGPLAVFQLAYYYREKGMEEDASILVKRLHTEKNMKAVGHDGELLVDKIY